MGFLFTHTVCLLSRQMQCVVIKVDINFGEIAERWTTISMALLLGLLVVAVISLKLPSLCKYYIRRDTYCMEPCFPFR
jgi:sensor histidine kinase regulating citrate/malate metabolism